MASSTSHPLASQVGGHAGVLSTEDDSLIIKPALPLELQFYQSLQQDPALEPLRPFTAKFLGVLKLEGQVDDTISVEQGGIAVKPVDDNLFITACSEPIQSLVLENLSHSFVKPNILDVKLGTVLYDESASPDKVARMQRTARETTSLETGIRLTGFQVYDNITSEAVNTPKSYGKSIRPSDLPDGIARFFPVGALLSEQRKLPGISTSGLPRSTLLSILRGIRENIAEIREAYATLEIRMVGGSLLIIYEADWNRAEEGLKQLGMAQEEGDDDDDDEDEDEDAVHPGPPYVVKLIDFAHARLSPGKGLDEGVLLGIDTMLRLIDGRIMQVESDK